MVVIIACPVRDFLRHAVGQILAYRFGCAVFPRAADVDFLIGYFHAGYLVDHLSERQGRAIGRAQLADAVDRGAVHHHDGRGRFDGGSAAWRGCCRGTVHDGVDSRHKYVAGRHGGFVLAGCGNRRSLLLGEVGLFGEAIAEVA